MDTNQESAPDWLELSELRTISLIDAIALSFGITPIFLHQNINSNPPHPTIKAIESELSRRITVSSNRADEFDEIAALYPENQRIGMNITIADYAAWVVDVMKWEVPQEFAALIKANKTESGLKTPQQIAKNSPLASTGNKLKSKESHPLRSLIDIAKARATDSEKDIDVWSQLLDLAQTKPPTPPLIGCVEGEGIKYQDAKGLVKLYTFKNLRDQLDRDNKKPT